MPGENSQSNQQNQNQSSNQGDNSNNNSNQNNNSQDQGDKEKHIPYSRFVEVNSKYKEANTELEKYREKERLENENKLKEEKKFQELIGTKDKEIETLKSENNQIKKERKVDSLKSKISNILSKNNVIDAEDGLKFVKYDDLIDSDDAEDEINKRVGELVKSKAYLFKAGQGSNTQNRSKTENNIPGNQQNSNQQTGDKKLSVADKVTSSLAEKFKF